MEIAMGKVYEIGEGKPTPTIQAVIGTGICGYSFLQINDIPYKNDSGYIHFTRMSLHDDTVSFYEWDNYVGSVPLKWLTVNSCLMPA